MRRARQAVGWRDAELDATLAASLDERVLESHVRTLASAVDRPVRNARLVVDPVPLILPEHPGYELDRTAVRALLRDALLARHEGEVVLPVRVIPPTVSAIHLAPRLSDAVDRPAVDAALVIGKVASISPERVGRRLDVEEAEKRIREARGEEPIVLPVAVVAPRVLGADLEPLRERVGDLLATGVWLTDGERAWRLSPAALRAALTVDGDPPVLRIHDTPLAPRIKQIAHEVSVPPVDAAISIDDGEVVVRPAVDGLAVDIDATIASAVQRLPAGESTLPVVVLTVPPSVSTEEVSRVAADVRAVLTRGLRVRVGDHVEALSPAEFGALLDVDRTMDGDWVIRLREDRARTWIGTLMAKYDRPPPEARLAFENGALTVRQWSSTTYWGVDASRALGELASSWRDGEVTIPLVERHEQFSTEQLAHLAPMLGETLAEVSLGYEWSNGDRLQNVELAIARIDGALILPGEEFSFNRAVGPTTLASGFRWGLGVAGGEGGPQFVPTVAGGICQVSSAIFQAAFLAGLPITERHPHSIWTPSAIWRGHVGLDSAVDEDAALDLRFRNTTGHPILVRARSTPDKQMQISLLGTSPGWTVQIRPQVTNVRHPSGPPEEVVTDTLAPGARLLVEAAQDGFTATITRTITLTNGMVRRDVIQSDYAPSGETYWVGPRKAS